MVCGMHIECSCSLLVVRFVVCICEVVYCVRNIGWLGIGVDGNVGVVVVVDHVLGSCMK